MTEFNKENFPGNSIKKPKEEKKVVRVTKGGIHKRKEPLLLRIFGGETAKSIGSYIWWDVIIPATKSTFADAINNSVDMIFYGSESRTKSSRLRRDKGRSYVGYNSMYNNRSQEPERRDRNRANHRFDDVIIETRADAEEVLSTLLELVDQYELCSVADFYEAVGLTSEYTDNKWGWEGLGQASIRPVRGGYILELPQPKPIQ